MSDRRVREMRRRGIRYVGGRTIETLAEACHLSVMDTATGEQWIQGAVYDYGKAKAHGARKRYAGPHGWDGQPVYWLRKGTLR